MIGARPPFRVATMCLARPSCLGLVLGALVLAGCDGSGSEKTGGTNAESSQSSEPPIEKSPQPGPPERPAIASSYVTPVDADTRKIRLDLIGLNRLGAGHLAVQVRLTNETDERAGGMWAQIADFMQGDAEWEWASGIGVVDAAARRLLLPYQTADDGCLCSSSDGTGFDGSLDPQASQVLFAVVPAPSDGAQRATVVTPIAPPFVDAPISNEAPSPPPGQSIPDPDQVEARTLAYPLETPIEALDNSAETHDDGERVHVNLSSDVLFALNKADLTPRARAVLKRTAGQIERSSGTTVEIAGHADSSGNDAINDPLSKRRADAVKAQLSRLVSRSRMRYRAEGFGSRRPLYPNASDAGRRRNRRVTVTFDKPQPAEPSPAGSTSSAEDQAGRETHGTYEGVPFSLEVTGLTRMSHDLGVLRYRMTNNGNREGTAEVSGISVEDRDAWTEMEAHAASGVYLVDRAAGVRYPPARALSNERRDRYCLCTQTSGVRLGIEDYEPGESKEFWMVVELPADARSLTAQVGKFPPLPGTQVR